MGELIPWGIWILSRHCHSSPRYEENHEVLPASVGCPGVCGTRGPCWLHSDGALRHRPGCFTRVRPRSLTTTQGELFTCTSQIRMLDSKGPSDLPR